MGYRTIHHEHDITGGAFIGGLASYAGFSLLILGVIGYLGFLCVQDWFSGSELTPDQYELTIAPAITSSTGVEEVRIEQNLHIVNHSDVVLTRVRLDRRVYTCPAGTDDIARCNKVREQPVYVDVQLAPGESSDQNLGEGLLSVPGSLQTDTVRVQNKILYVEGDADTEA